ncbi:fibronectin/fibrinogen-binding protein [Veillonellaceae bacterium WCA-693-APC-5D-A]|uniref:Rqc2 homolog RqcH n=1 Tax=Anaerovibrio slackiae TaxID=2652309 RepID=A0A6I2UC35_9FIRM|nr:NFACT RNA binding domain-containing protein [Anaerovibrio slackiae]MSU07445.1 fibronectin/fibrinogen-binding protein [Anaerovibrio slackiae]
MSLDGISMHPLAIELDRAVAGGRIDRINQPSKQSIVMSLRLPGKNVLLHITINPQNPAMHLIDKAPENPPEPPMFCMVLRKHLETGRIAGVRQYGLDRLLIMDIDFLSAGGKIITKTLVVELMGKYSNIILVQDGIIIDALRKVGTNSSRVRTVLPGDAYVLPPQQDKLNLLETPIREAIAAIRTKGDMKLSKAILDTCLGFGPVTAKEAAYGAGLPASMTISQLNEGDFASLENALQEITDSFREPCGAASIVIDKNHKPLATASFPLHYLTNETILTFPTISEMLGRASSLTGSYQIPDKDRFRKLMKNELNRAENKVQKLRDDIAAADNAEEYRIKADNLMTYQYQFQDRVDAEVTVPNIYSETGESITIRMDQRLSVVENVQAYYKKYDKLKRGKELLEQQLQHCLDDIQYMSSIEASLESSTRLAEINDIKAELIASGILREKPKKHAAEKQSQPFKFTASDGTQILVGKNNYQNDRLTFKTANPGDIWLHTQNIPGSHVILRCDGDEPAEDTLLLASYLAVHFSKAQGSSKVPVDYTRARFVKKPSGAKPGFVIFTNQTTLYVTPEAEVLQPVLLQEA